MECIAIEDRVYMVRSFPDEIGLSIVSGSCYIFGVDCLVCKGFW